MSKQQATYEAVAQTIISQLEKGIAPWRKEWVSSGYTALSLSTKRPYRGTNAFLLSFSAMANGYASPHWGTYKQIAAIGGQVRKGEKSTPVVLWKQLKVEDEATGKEKVVPMLRSFNVFNAEQCDWENGAPEYEKPAARDNVQIIESAQNVLNSYLQREATLQFNTKQSDRAFYSPVQDSITMPLMELFTSDEAFYATAFHEAAHSTGHATRLAREGVTENHYFGDPTYSEEELVAEFTAAFLCGHTGLAPSVIDNSAAYIKSWLKVLQNDPKVLVRATSRAQKAADYILNVKPEGETKNEEQ